MATERDLQIIREVVEQGTSKEKNLGVMREVVRSLFPTSKAQDLQVCRETVIPYSAYNSVGRSFQVAREAVIPYVARARRPQVWVIT